MILRDYESLQGTVVGRRNVNNAMYIHDIVQKVESREKKLDDIN